MMQVIHDEHWNDANGNPAGGVSQAIGLLISWQNGPLGKGEDRKEPNGAFVETVIAAAHNRLQYYQQSKFNCKENAEAIYHLRQALEWCEKRTNARVKRDVEGTHEV